MVVQIGCLLDQAPHGEGGALVIRGGGGGGCEAKRQTQDTEGENAQYGYGVVGQYFV